MPNQLNVKTPRVLPPARLPVPDMRQSPPLARWPSVAPSEFPSNPSPLTRSSLARSGTLSGCMAHLPFFSQSVSQSVSPSLSLRVESPFHDPPPPPLVHRDPWPCLLHRRQKVVHRDLLPTYVSPFSKLGASLGRTHFHTKLTQGF